MEIDHGTLIKWVNESEDTTVNSRATAEKCRDYYDSKQWSSSDAAELKKRGQAAIVVNRVKPKMDGLLGMEKANRTTAKAFPRTPKENHDADAATEAIRFVLDDNSYPQVRSAAFENISIEGTGGCEVIVDKKRMEIRINPIFWDRIIYDPHSRRKDFSDARFLGQVTWMDFDLAAQMYPEKKDLLEDMIGSNSQTYEDKPRWMETTRRRVKIVELYYKEKSDVYYACFTRGGFLKDPQVSPYKNEVGETEWPYEYASGFVDRDGNRYGAAMQLLDIQDEVNKRRSKALHLMSVRQVRLERGSVEDVNKTRSELAKPDGVIETTPGMEFEVLKTGDMAAAQFNLLTEAKQEIDAVGFNAAVSGKLDGAQSGVALRTRQMAGQTELAPLFDVLKNLDIRVYRKVWNRIRQFWTDEKWIRVTDDEQNIKFVGLNRKITKGEMLLKQAETKGAPQEIIEQLKVKISQDPMMQEAAFTENSVAELDVDINIADAPDAASMEVEQFQGLAEVIKSGAPPVLVEALIMSSQIPHKERVLKNLRGEQEIPDQVKQQIQQMQEQMQKLDEENQKLKTQDAEGLAKVEHQKQVDAAKFTQSQQQAEQEFKLKAYIQAEELKLAREKAEQEMRLKREIAAADLEIENKKMSAQNEQARQKQDFEQKVKFAESPELAEAQVIPKVAEALMMFAQAFEGMNRTLQNGAEIQKKTLQVQMETLQTLKSPKKVSLSGIQRNAAGTITGATVNPTIQ